MENVYGKMLLVKNYCLTLIEFTLIFKLHNNDIDKSIDAFIISKVIVRNQLHTKNILYLTTY